MTNSEVLNITINYLFISLPEFYVMTIWGAILFGFPYKDLKYRLLVMAASIAFTSDVMWILEDKISVDLRVIVTIVLFIIFYRFIIKENSWIKALMMTLLFFISQTISESIIVVIFLKYYSYDDIMNNLFLKFLVTLGYISPFILATYLFNKKKWSVKNVLKVSFPDRKTKYYWLGIIFLAISQLVVIFYLNYIYFFIIQNFENKIVFDVNGLPIMSTLLVVVNIILIILIVKTIRHNATIEIQKTESNYNNYLENLLEKLRMERHDFINEIQTIHGFVQTKMYNHLEDYMSELVKNTNGTNRIIKIKNPAVSSYIHTKVAQIEESRVKLHIITKTNDTFSSIKSYDLVKIISNLLDNALRAVTEDGVKDPFIEIYWGKEKNKAVIKVSNNGPKIDEKEIDLLFKEGYTTKKEVENSGYGLAIVKESILKYKGVIKVKSSEDLTSFIIQLPL